uniref:Uncharacterized protein n=1 Tax=Candidatus Kentrum sp. DK TaxID=2126562 RepID=A0A450SGJ2_9GAMM|nr:MAG: hypothetical protein BECKDK2373C_GA0170839_10357 [Candidatus Kentron sp. DK]
MGNIFIAAKKGCDKFIYKEKSYLDLAWRNHNRIEKVIEEDGGCAELIHPTNYGASIRNR